MRGRIRIAAVGLVALAVAGRRVLDRWCAGRRPVERARRTEGSCRSTSSTPFQVAGGGSEADASNAPMAEASGTGACLSTAASTNPCPTSATVVARRADALDSTQDAVAKGDGTTATPTGPEQPARSPSTPACSTSTSSAAPPRRPRTAAGTRRRRAAAASPRVAQPEPDRRPAGDPRRPTALGVLVCARTRPRRLGARSNTSPLSAAGAVGPGHRQRDPAGQPRPQPDERRGRTARSPASARW